MNQTKKKEKSSVSHKILTVIGVVLCVILTPILIINCTLIIRSQLDKDAVPSIGGIFPMIVLTNSMYPEFESGDLIICHTVAAEDVEVGDVIVFYDPAGDGTSVVTHRVAEITEDENGNPAWRTKGDANNTEDPAVVSADDLIGEWNDIRFANLGNVALFMQTTTGLIVCVVIPLVLLVGYDILRRRISDKKNDEDTDALMKELEELRKLKKEKEEKEAEDEKSSSDRE